MADSRETKIVSYELQGNTTDLMHELQSAISTLDALDSKLTQISASARMIGGRDKTTFSRAAAISTAETQIGRLRSQLDPTKIEAVSPDQLNLLKQMNAELTSTVAKLSGFKSASTVTQKALDKTTTTLRLMNREMRNASLTTTETATAFNKLYTSLRSLYSKFILIRVLLNYFLKLYDVTAEYVEVINLFNVATKESRQELDALANSMANAYNTDISPIYNALAVFRQYANTMGFAQEQADILSEGLTKITYDLSSLYNTTYSDMTKAVKSGLAGQTKSLMQYGISVHKATLEQYAMNLGLEKSWSAYTETEKVALRYIAILDQASSAQGDLARTLESPSNQMKVAKAQVTILVRNLGALVQIVSQHVLPVFNGLTMAVNSFLSVLTSAAGFKIEDYSDNLKATNEMFDDGTESVEEYEDAVNGLLAPLDEINQATPKDEGVIGGLDPAILEALQSYDNLMGQISTKADTLADVFGEAFDPEFFEGVGAVLGVVFETLGQGVDIATGALGTLSPVLGVVLELVGYLLQGAAWLLGNVVSPVLSFVQVLTSNIWLLVAAFTAFNLMQLAATGNMKSMVAVKIAQWFATLATNIWGNVTAYTWYIAASIKAKAASLAAAAAAWWEAAAWWQKAIAVIAAAGAMALVVGGIVMAATASAQSQANSTMNTTPNIPAMARGGVVSVPTVALVGEGRYNEAVVPLGNSPQFKTMKDDIANAVLSKIGPTPSASGQPSASSTRPVVLMLDGREVARGLLPIMSNVQLQTGVSFK